MKYYMIATMAALAKAGHDDPPPDEKPSPPPKDDGPPFQFSANENDMGKCYGLVQFGNDQIGWTPQIEMNGEYKCNTETFGENNFAPGSGNGSPAKYEKKTGLCDGGSRGKTLNKWRKKTYEFCEAECSRAPGGMCKAFVFGNGNHMYKGTCELYDQTPEKSDGNVGW